MSLQRTPDGLANLHLFYKVDIIIYCEGGASLTLAEVEGGQGDEETLDVSFWQAIFINFGSAPRAHYKSVGSKTILTSLATTVVDANVQNVLICMDRDHDFRCGRNLVDPRIVYTFGYSWENDVISSEVLEQIFFDFRNRNENSERDFRKFLAQFKGFLASAKKYCNYDLCFIQRLEAGMFPRSAPTSSLVITPGEAPKLNEVRLKKMLTDRGFKRGPRPTVAISHNEVSSALFGKLLASFVYQAAKHSCGKPAKNITWELFMRLLIARFVDEIRGGGLCSIRSYYSSVIP